MGSYYRLYLRIQTPKTTIMGLLGYLKLNYLAIIQNIFLFLSWILVLANSGWNTNDWSKFFFFIGWYMHYHFCFNDYDCKKVGEGRFNQVMTIFQAIIVFNFWAQFNTTTYSNAALCVGIFQSLSFLMYIINDFVGLFFDFKVLRPIRSKK